MSFLTRKERYVVAVMGATGAVGQEMVDILEERKFPVSELRLLASERSEGSMISFGDQEIRVQKLTEKSFDGVDIVLGATDSALARTFTPMAVHSGAVVIDNSSAYRMAPEVPLVVPEVNGHLLATHQGIIANPNCAAAQLVVALKPLHDAAQIRRVVVTTFQAVSGTGKEAMEELMDQTRAILSFQEVVCRVYPVQIAFNCIVNWECDAVSGDTEEEIKIVNETKKMMGDDQIQVTATTVRVPVFRAHSEAVNVETLRKLSVRDVRALLADAPGVTLMDDPSRKLYPTPLDAAGRDAVYVGRIREDVSIPNGIHLWVVADNLRKGAALNAVQIAEALIR